MLDSLTVARSAGLEVQRRGSRWFASSPFRNERTPSLCFFPDGRWHDFGGGQSGDAADLYAALHGVTLGEALRVVRGEEWHPKPRQPTAYDLKRAIDAWKGMRWREACAKKNEARAIIKALEITEPDSEKFWQAVADAAAAEDTLNLLDSLTPRQALQMMDGGDTNEQPV